MRCARLAVPTLFFVNKIDRAGADDRRVLAAIVERLDATVVAMDRPREIGTHDAGVVTPESPDGDLVEALAVNDDRILRRYLDGEPVGDDAARRGPPAQTAARLVHPVYFGSAMTGAGVEELLTGIVRLLPPAVGDPAGPVSGTVFKIGRGPKGEKVSLVRMFAGTLSTRDRVRPGNGDDEDRVTAIRVFEQGTTRPRRSTVAGEIAEVRGLTHARIGDHFGEPGPDPGRSFSPPTLETAVVSHDPRRKSALFAALADLAEQDPLINLRQDDARGELYLSLYGEVQREIVAATLLADHGIEVEFRPVTPICVERPRGSGSAIETIPPRRSPLRPFLATVGLDGRPARRPGPV